ncbi:MAG: hypothetical protein HOP99_05355 [Dermatophilaceae bacterium]|nr:hypothetical protein [Dermatophilaceae bacterium]
MMAFTARYPGDCADCGGPINVGDLIKQTDGEYVHADNCTPDRLDDTETVCPRCFLTTSDCGKDL